MEKLLLKGTIGCLGVDKFELNPIFDISNLSVSLGLLDSDLKVSYKVLYDEWSKENNNILNITNEKNFQQIIIYIKNTGEENRSYDISISYLDEHKRTFTELNATKFHDMTEFAKLSAIQEDTFDLFINVNDGIPVIYHRVKTVSEDNILKEAKYKKFFEKNCLNLLLEDNVLPSLEDAVMTEWGSEFLTFDGWFSVLYFEHFFGKCEEPVEGDYIIMPIINQAFEVKGVVIERDATGKADSFKLKLGEYEERDSVETDESFSESVQRHEDEFGAQTIEEIENVVNIKENSQSYIYDDVQKGFVSEDIVMSGNMYEMGIGSGNAVTYKDFNSPIKNISISVSPHSDCEVLRVGMSTIKVQGSRFMLDNLELCDVELGEQNWLSINFFDTHISVVKLNSSMKEVFHKEETALYDLISNGVSLDHGDYEIHKLALCAKRITRNKSNFVFSSSSLDNSGEFVIVDNFTPTYNTPKSNMGSKERRL